MEDGEGSISDAAASFHAMLQLREAFNGSVDPVSDWHWVGCHTIERAGNAQEVEWARELILFVWFHSPRQPLSNKASKSLPKCSYLLLDLRVLASYNPPDLPAYAFHQAIFYVGKGYLDRPQRYAFEAYNGDGHAKSAWVRDIWKSRAAFQVFSFEGLTDDQSHEYEALLLEALTGACGHFLWTHYNPSLQTALNHDHDFVQRFPFGNQRLCNSIYGSPKGPAKAERIRIGLALLEYAHASYIKYPEKYLIHHLPTE